MELTDTLDSFADPGQILSGFPEKDTKISERRQAAGWPNLFCLARGVPRKILNIKCLRLAEIGLPATCFEDIFICHSVKIALATGDFFKTYHILY